MKNISVQQMHETLKNNPDAQFIDVREQEEFDEVHAQGVRLIPMSELTTRAHEIDTNEEVFLICRSGGRSTRVGEYLEQALGAEHVVNVDGGTNAWVEAELPTNKWV